MSEMRWDPFQQEWVISASHRQDRPLLSQGTCPLCPGILEVPRDYQIAVFENRYPSFSRFPSHPDVEGHGMLKVGKSQGICEVVLYTPDHDLTLTDLPPDHIFRLLQVWTDRYVELGSLPFIKYVYIFENKGEVIGVTLSHPHGQIYAFPYIPPRVKRELVSAEEYHTREKRCLYCSYLEEEMNCGERIVHSNDDFVALVPFFARYPYEIHIYPLRHLKSLEEIDDHERRSLAHLLKDVLLAYDTLYSYSFPYILALYQEPTDGRDFPYFHLHLEFYPPMRAADKQKFPAGCEVGTGTFLNDTAPEAKAEELRVVLNRSRG
jgi:UDPglucose--hexose-1-phosphate uridylyltransferase